MSARLPAEIHLHDVLDAVIALTDRDSGFLDAVAESVITGNFAPVTRMAEQEVARLHWQAQDEADEARAAA